MEDNFLTESMRYLVGVGMELTRTETVHQDDTHRYVMVTENGVRTEKRYQKPDPDFDQTVRRLDQFIDVVHRSLGLLDDVAYKTASVAVSSGAVVCMFDYPMSKGRVVRLPYEQTSEYRALRMLEAGTHSIQSLRRVLNSKMARVLDSDLLHQVEMLDFSEKELESLSISETQLPNKFPLREVELSVGDHKVQVLPIDWTIKMPMYNCMPEHFFEAQIRLELEIVNGQLGVKVYVLNTDQLERQFQDRMYEELVRVEHPDSVEIFIGDLR